MIEWDTTKRDEQRKVKRKEYKARHKNKPYNKPNTEYKPWKFVAIDGEGDNVNGKHVLTLLATSNGKSIQRKIGIHTWEIFDFLFECMQGETSRTRLVGFSFGYDTTMILRDLPKDKLKELAKEDRIWVTIFPYRYQIKWTQRKWLKI